MQTGLTCCLSSLVRSTPTFWARSQRRTQMDRFCVKFGSLSWWGPYTCGRSRNPCAATYSYFLDSVTPLSVRCEWCALAGFFISSQAGGIKRPLGWILLHSGSRYTFNQLWHGRSSIAGACLHFLLAGLGMVDGAAIAVHHDGWPHHGNAVINSVVGSRLVESSRSWGSDREPCTH